MSALVAFVRLARPLFLGGGFIGFALGAAAARFDGVALAPGAYLLGQAMVTSFQLMVHFANDYYDQAGDRLTVRTPFSGGSGVLVTGDVSPQTAFVIAGTLAAFGAALVLRAEIAGEWLLAGIGVAIGALAWAYSAPPLRLTARGLGELDTVVVVGLLVPLAGYVAFAHALGPHVLAATVPGMCATFAMMVCVEIPDAAADAASGKQNLVVRWGSARALGAARFAAAGAAAALFGLAAAVAVPPPLALEAAAVPALLALVLIASTGLRLAESALPLVGVAHVATTGLAALALLASA